MMDSSRNPKRQANKALVPAIVSSSSRLLPGTRLFASIGNVFGRDALRSARRWETFALREASTYSQIRFLHRCLDNNVLPKCVSYKPPVNTDLARRAVFQHGRRMIRVLLQDCHARLRKYRQRIDQEKTRCCEFMGEIGTNLLLQRIAEQAREQRMIRDAALENKFRKLPNPTSPRNDKLVHNLSSKELTKDQMQVLRHEASFNTTDAKPVNMIAAVESILSQTEATEETKSLIRHQVSSLLMAHRPREVLSKVEREALRELKADKDLVIVPADKGRSTVVLDRTDYLQKAKGDNCWRSRDSLASTVGPVWTDWSLVRSAWLRDSQLLKKFERISSPTRPPTDGVLVHNFSSRHLTQQQLAVLSYDTKFNTRDARPEDFIASFESALQKCEANEECKNSMRQQVSTLLLRRKPQRAISETEDRELLRIRKMRDIVTLPADKGRSTVVMDKADYTTKLQSLLEDEGAYELSEIGEFKKHVNSVNRAIDKLRKAGALKRNEALAAKATDAAMARFYGLPKVHKPGVPLRP
ncbi:hypothetical protein SprV_0401456400 [Sparganum proliferum]